MLLILLVFITDFAITFFASKSSLALNRLSYKAIWWDCLCSVAIGLNFIGFIQLQWVMILPSTLGSMLGIGVTVYAGRRKSHSDL